MTLQITVMAPHIPHAALHHAGGRFLYDWVSALSTQAKVTVVAPVWNSEPSTAAGNPWTTIAVAVPLTPESRLTKLRNVLRFGPDQGVVTAHANHAEVARLLADSDLVEVHWTEWLAVEGAVSGHGRPVVCVAVELLADAKARQISGAEHLRTRLIGRVQRPVLARAEMAAIERCAGVLTVSERDAQLMREAGVRIPVRRVSPRLDESAPGIGPSKDEVALFLARLDVKQNSHAVRWLLEDIWPRVRAQRPAATLVIAGAGQEHWMHSDPSAGVEFTGPLDDLHGAYRDARVALAPLKRGSGMKFKVAQALIAGLPVVTTTIGADGFIELGGREHFAAVTDDAAPFAQAIVELLADFDRSRRVGADAAQWSASVFDFDRHFREAFAWYETLVG